MMGVLDGASTQGNTRAEQVVVVQQMVGIRPVYLKLLAN